MGPRRGRRKPVEMWQEAKFPQVRYQVVLLSPYPLHGGVLEGCVYVCLRGAVIETRNVQEMI